MKLTEIYLITVSIPSVVLLLIAIITAFIMQIGSTDYELCRAGSSSEHLRSHLRGSVVSAFVICLVYMNMLFKGITPIYRWNGVIMSVILLGAFGMHIVNIIWMGGSKCTSTTFYTFALVNTIVFWLMFIIIAIFSIILMVKTMCKRSPAATAPVNKQDQTQ